MKIVFHSNQISFRGTEVALFDYAHFAEELYGYKSIILTAQHANHHPSALQKFSNRFDLHFYSDPNEISHMCEQVNADLFYAIKAGHLDNIESKSCKSVNHVVFKNYEPHGDVYAYVSKWLAQEMNDGKSPFVPHMVQLPQVDTDLRTTLNIPKNAVVFGRHGPTETFDIPYVRQQIMQTLKQRPDAYFIFMGLKPFGQRWWSFAHHPRLRFLPVTTDLVYKTQFINTCDAMIHARQQGESFGLSVAEFSIRNKPVITCTVTEEKAHLQMLGDKGIYYHDAQSLLDVLMHFKPNPTANWNAYSLDYSPEKVMQKFKQVFVD